MVEGGRLVPLVAVWGESGRSPVRESARLPLRRGRAMTLLRVDLQLRPASCLLGRHAPSDGALVVVGSDTLWAGLISCATEEGGPDAADRLKAWALEGRVRVSSLFPRVAIQGPDFQSNLLLYPQPLVSMTSRNHAAAVPHRRRFFVSQGILETMLNAVVQTESGLRTQVAFGDADVLSLFNEALASLADFRSLPESIRETVVRAALALDAPPFALRPCATMPGTFEAFADRKTIACLPGGQDLSFSGAFFFLIDVDDEARDDCLTWIRLLADAGVGKGRTAGRGAFDLVEIAPHEIAVRTGGKRLFASLSVIAPSPEEARRIVAADLTKREFRLAESGRTVCLRMLAEGAICRSGVEGRAVAIDDSFERFGFAFPVYFGAVR